MARDDLILARDDLILARDDLILARDDLILKRGGITGITKIGFLKRPFLVLNVTPEIKNSGVGADQKMGPQCPIQIHNTGA